MAARKFLGYLYGYPQRAYIKPLDLKMSRISTCRHFSRTFKTKTHLFSNQNNNIHPLLDRYNRGRLVAKIKRTIPTLDTSSFLSYLKNISETFNFFKISQQSIKNVEQDLLDCLHKPEFLKIYKQYLENDGKQLNARFLSKYMLQYSMTDAVDKKEVLQDVYSQIDNPMFCANYGDMACAFAYINDWKKMDELLDLCQNAVDKDITTKQSYVSVYSKILNAAIHQNNPEQFFSIFERFRSEFNTVPKDDVMLKYFTSCGKENSLFRAIDFLKFVEGFEWVAEKSTADIIIQHFLEYEKENWICKKGHAEHLKCSSCGNRLQENELTDKEVEILRKFYYENVIHFFNVFRTTTKDELVDFENFMQEHGPFDVVIDGLNTGHSSLRHFGHFAESHVTDFLDLFHDKKILMILKSYCHDIKRTLRKYKGPNKVLSFSAAEHTKDDVFVIYGALLSGKHAKLISNDFMRDANPLLPTDIAPILVKWRNMNHIEYDWTNGKLYLKEPLKHRPHISKDENAWHIPYSVPVKSVRQGSSKRPYFHICLMSKKDEKDL